MIKLFVLHLAKGLGIFALFRILTRTYPRILCYHGGSLGDEHHFNAKLFCRPGLLEQRLQWLERKGFTPSSLDRLSRAPADRAHVGIPLVVTLDDGWYSSYTDLLPVLARHGHEPVLYLATKVFAQGGPVVDVCLNYICWKSSLTSVQLAGYSPALDGAYALSASADRARLCNAAEIWMDSFEGDNAAVVAALERFAAALGVTPEAFALSSRRFSYARRDELLAAAGAGCRIELHGHAHKYLPGQSERNRADIAACRQHIAAAGLPAPRHYCYPSGDFDDQAPATMAAMGVSTATTCVPGLVHGIDGDRRYFLPRFLDGSSVSMIEFEAEMSGVLEFVRRIAGRMHGAAPLSIP